MKEKYYQKDGQTNDYIYAVPMIGLDKDQKISDRMVPIEFLTKTSSGIDYMQLCKPAINIMRKLFGKQTNGKHNLQTDNYFKYISQNADCNNEGIIQIREDPS